MSTNGNINQLQVHNFEQPTTHFRPKSHKVMFINNSLDILQK
jgi:hypothetical protein